MTQKSDNIKWGIIGGTFDPIHIGHLHCAAICKKKLKLNKVFFMPANIPNFKKNNNVTDAVHRINMCQNAIDWFNDGSFEVSDFEIKMGSVSYTSYTMEKFKSVFAKNIQLFFICGTDTVYTIEKWYNFKKIFKYATIISVSRDGFKKNIQLENYLKSKYRIKFIDTCVENISSSTIRKSIKEGMDISNYVCESNIEYIKENNLYL